MLGSVFPGVPRSSLTFAIAPGYRESNSGDQWIRCRRCHLIFQKQFQYNVFIESVTILVKLLCPVMKPNEKNLWARLGGGLMQGPPKKDV